LQLYNFVDNHDVDRVASKLNNPAWLYPLYLLLFTMPGIPAIYYGSEWGVQGEKEPWSDAPLRPKLDLKFSQEASYQGSLVEVIRQLAHIRSYSTALKGGHYSPIFVSGRQFAFLRESGDETILVILNSAEDPVEIHLDAPGHVVKWIDLLDTNQSYLSEGQNLNVNIPPTWGRILKAVRDKE
jgi:glycosidase